MNVAVAKWVSIFADIIEYEFSHAGDGMLLSEQCYRWVERWPVSSRVVIGLFGLSLTAHLGCFVPERFDLWRKTYWLKVTRGRAHE